MAVAFSPDNRQIASGGRDKNLKIWNTVGECKFTVEQNAHTDWVSCVKFYQDVKNPIVVSASWDKTIKVWDNQTMALKHTMVGHTSQINSLDMAPKASFLASGGKDGIALIWQVVEGKFLGNIDAECPINVVLFAPKKYWLILGTEQGVKVWDLPSKEFVSDIKVWNYPTKSVVADVKANPQDAKQEKNVRPLGCTSLAWNKAGTLLFAGFTDNLIRVFKVMVTD